MIKLKTKQSKILNKLCAKFVLKPKTKMLYTKDKEIKILSKLNYNNIIKCLIK